MEESTGDSMFDLLATLTRAAIVFSKDIDALKERIGQLEAENASLRQSIGDTVEKAIVAYHHEGETDRDTRLTIKIDELEKKINSLYLPANTHLGE